MNKETHNTLVPVLRFPEFQDEEGWEEIPLGQKIDLLSGYAFQSIFFSDNGQKLVTPKNFTKEGFPNFNKENTKFTSEKIDTKYICGEGDLMILLTDLTSSCELLGKPLLLGKKDGEVLLNQRIVKILPKKNINIHFLFYFFLTESYHKRIKNTASGSTVRHSSNSIILDTYAHFPSEAEQQKIADCLSSLDELIQTESQVLEALKTHKKGLMQQLFPAEGETVPQLRFPEFMDDEEWEEKSLGEMTTSFSGGTPSTSKKDYYGGEIPFIRSAEIDKNSTELFLTENGFKNSSAKMVSKGDVLVALYGANSGDVALSKMDGAINQAILCLKSQLCNPFIYQFLSFKKNWIVKTYIQGGQGNLSGEIIKSINLPFPTLPEQQKIADCLSSLDEQIATKSQQIEALKIHKKGLMQQLFPTIDDRNI